MASEQAKSAIKRLLNAGLKRSQFSVTTKRYVVDGDMYYGSAEIYLKGYSDNDNFMNYLKSILDNGFNVIMLKKNGYLEYPLVIDTYNETGELQILDLWNRWQTILIF